MTTVEVFHMQSDGSYSKVAKVFSEHKNIDAALEEAFAKTQNIEGSWSRPQSFEIDGKIIENSDYHPNVTVLAELIKYEGVEYGLKSTSIFDIMVIDNNKYQVAFVGFEPIQNDKF